MMRGCGACEIVPDINMRLSDTIQNITSEFLLDDCNMVPTLKSEKQQSPIFSFPFFNSFFQMKPHTILFREFLQRLYNEDNSKLKFLGEIQ